MQAQVQVQVQVHSSTGSNTPGKSGTQGSAGTLLESRLGLLPVQVLLAPQARLGWRRQLLLLLLLNHQMQQRSLLQHC